jgi:hypothetical protein
MDGRWRMTPLNVVLFSGGAGSWAAAKRVAERHGTDGLVLLFTDTKTEDEDLYRFITEAAANVGGELVTLSDGRDVWQVFFDVRYLGNTRIDPCSRILKRDLARQWVWDNCDPDETTIYLGIDWTEVHRYERAAPRWAPFKVEAPMCDKPYMDKAQVLDWLRAEGIQPPRLYEMGFPHNNCGGFCVKAGQASFRLLLERMPERYAYHEAKEQELRDHLGSNVAILKHRSGPDEGKPLTLREFRERLERQPALFDHYDYGGCGCMLDEGA